MMNLLKLLGSVFPYLKKNVIGMAIGAILALIAGVFGMKTEELQEKICQTPAPPSAVEQQVPPPPAQ